MKPVIIYDRRVDEKILAFIYLLITGSHKFSWKNRI